RGRSDPGRRVVRRGTTLRRVPDAICHRGTAGGHRATGGAVRRAAGSAPRPDGKGAAVARGGHSRRVGRVGEPCGPEGSVAEAAALVSRGRAFAEKEKKKPPRRLGAPAWGETNRSRGRAVARGVGVGVTSSRRTGRRSPCR